MRITKDHIRSILFGTAVGDALGVPVEFKSREFLKANPVTEMIGNGTHHQPKGTWSDDSSMSFCLAETLLDNTFELRSLSNRFINWIDHGYWAPHGEAFDIGNTTLSAIEKLKIINNPIDAGGRNEGDNGNGSLMRILPLVIKTIEMPIPKIYDLVKQVSSLTHGHVRSINCCFYYLIFAREIMFGQTKQNAYEISNREVNKILLENEVSREEIFQLKRILDGRLSELKEYEILSNGYVINSLEASIWSLMNSQSYKEAVLKAVNLGEDTDTTGAITGGVAALHFGFKSIPSDWIDILVKKNEISMLANKLIEKYCIKIMLEDIPSFDDVMAAAKFSHKFSGYLATFKETANVAKDVRSKILSDNTEKLEVEDLATSLFFYFRAIRHGGDPPDTKWINKHLNLMKAKLQEEKKSTA